MLAELGIQPIINAVGTLTILGGALLSDEVLEAISEVAKVHLDMVELHERAGRYVARLVGAESAYICSGAAAGLVLSVAACMTGGDVAKMLALPDTSGCRNEVIVQRPHRNIYDHLIKIPGAKIREVGDDNGVTRQQFKDSIDDRSAAVVYFVFAPQEGVLPLEEVISVSHDRGVPVIVDAAAELPPADNLRKFARMGADLVVFSGGKDIGAPNDTGIIIGRRDLVEVCKRLGPHSYEVYDSKTVVFLGRPMKTSKEDIVGFVVALKKYMNEDEISRIQRYESIAMSLVSKLSGCKSLSVRKIYPGAGHPRPASVARVQVEVKGGPLTAHELMERLKAETPPVYTYVVDGKLYINPHCLREGDEKVVAAKILKLVDGKS